MAFADTSSASIAIAKEVTYGVNPGTGAVYARFTSDTLQQDNATKTSAEVAADRNPRGLVRTDISAKGDINFEFSSNNFDDLLAAALCSDWVADVLTLGAEKTSFTIERQWNDVNVFELFTGMNVATASLTITPGDIVKGKFGFLGARQVDFTSSQIGTIADAGGEQVMNAVDNVEAVWEGGFVTPSTFCFTEISFDIDNKLRLQHCIGALGASGIGLSIPEIKGTIKLFLEDKTMIDKFLNFTASKFQFKLTDVGAGESYIFSFPKIHFSTGTDFITGNAADGIVELGWSAEKETGGSDSAMYVTRATEVS